MTLAVFFYMQDGQSGNFTSTKYVEAIVDEDETNV